MASKTEAMPIARVYADALWNVAARDGQEESVVAELEGVEQILDSHPALGRVFELPTISQDDRQETIEKLLQGRISDVLFSFLTTLNRHGRLGILRSCLAALKEIRDARAGIVEVEVRSAVPLTDNQRKEIEKLIRSRFNIEPRLRAEIDKALLGGLWVRVGDTVLDQTLQTSLRKLRDVIQTRSNHEIQSGRNFFDS